MNSLIRKISVITTLLVLTSCLAAHAADRDYGNVIYVKDGWLTTIHPKQKLIYPFKKGEWKLAYQDKSLAAPLMIFVPQNAKKNDFTQSMRLSVIFSEYQSKASPQWLYDMEMQVGKTCKHFESKIIEKNKDYLIYETKRVGCKATGNPLDQYQITKAFKGKDGTYFARYSATLGKVVMADIDAKSQEVIATRLVSN